MKMKLSPNHMNIYIMKWPKANGVESLSYFSPKMLAYYYIISSNVQWRHVANISFYRLQTLKKNYTLQISISSYSPGIKKVQHHDNTVCLSVSRNSNIMTSLFVSGYQEIATSWCHSLSISSTKYSSLTCTLPAPFVTSTTSLAACFCVTSHFQEIAFTRLKSFSHIAFQLWVALCRIHLYNIALF